MYECYGRINSYNDNERNNKYTHHITCVPCFFFFSCPFSFLISIALLFRYSWGRSIVLVYVLYQVSPVMLLLLLVAVEYTHTQVCSTFVAAVFVIYFAVVIFLLHFYSFIFFLKNKQKRKAV